MRRASAAVLRPADVAANFRVDRTGFAVPMVPVCADYPGDRSGTTVTGEARSAFRDGTPGIGSKVLFFKTPPDLDRYWALTVRNRFASCFAQKYDAIERPGSRRGRSSRRG